MATISHDGLAVCTDCAGILANGTLGLEDDAADSAHAELIAAQWPGGNTLVLSGHEDEEPSFSWQRCDGCGSTLGGDRHEAVAFDN